jgi:hypothetical protein
VISFHWVREVRKIVGDAPPRIVKRREVLIRLLKHRKAKPEATK